MIAIAPQIALAQSSVTSYGLTVAGIDTVNGFVNFATGVSCSNVAEYSGRYVQGHTA
jgi:hypothetical protein